MEVRSISLRKSLRTVSFVGTSDIVASRFCCDSRRIQPGDVFVALRGSRIDGHQHLEAAIAGGAISVIVERPASRIDVPQCVVANTRVAFAKICLERLGSPQRSINVIGVTGTNGKTTTTWLLRSILETAGRTTGLLGTLEYFDGRTAETASLTTPDSEQLAQYMAQMARNRVTDCVMEISSHALHQQRCAGITLNAAAITNITHDHFDYHGDAERYRAAKLRIASLLASDRPILLGIDDPGCQAICEQLTADRNVLTFGFSPDASVRVESLSCSQTGQTLRLLLHGTSIEICGGLEQVLQVPGRMERIDVGQPFAVFVDYAHTPDGIAQCVATARTLTSGRVVLAFGAGGDRDRRKRPLMALAAKDADAVVVTSDNPRSEVPDQIIGDIVGGFDSLNRVLTCVDRQQGIREALRLAQPGDVVIIAGRGHETNQEFGDRKICFDDRRVTRRLLLELLTGSLPGSASQRSAISA